MSLRHLLICVKQFRPGEMWSDRNEWQSFHCQSVPRHSPRWSQTLHKTPKRQAAVETTCQYGRHDRRHLVDERVPRVETGRGRDCRQALCWRIDESATVIQDQSTSRRNAHNNEFCLHWLYLQNVHKIFNLTSSHHSLYSNKIGHGSNMSGSMNILQLTKIFLMINKNHNKFFSMNKVTILWCRCWRFVVYTYMFLTMIGDFAVFQLYVTLVRSFLHCINSVICIAKHSMIDTLHLSCIEALGDNAACHALMKQMLVNTTTLCFCSINKSL